MHLLVDSTGLRLFGPGGWLEDKHGIKRRQAWRMLHLATDADTGHIVASVLTSRDTDDSSQVGPLLDWVAGSAASLTGDGDYDQDDVYAGHRGAASDADVTVLPFGGWPPPARHRSSAIRTFASGGATPR